MKTRMISRMALGVSAAVLGLMIAPVITASAALAAPVGGGGAYHCTGGNVAPGTYRSITITGVCYMPAGTVVVRGNLTVAPGALLNAVSPGDPPASPVVPATVLIGGNVFVGKGAVLVLGCSPNISCSSPPGISFDRIGGNLTAIGSLGVVIHSATIGGSVSVLGGGGGAAGGANSGACFTSPTPAPWSEDAALIKAGNNPQYTDVEDSSIGGNLTVAGVQTCWLGTLRNQVRGSLTYANDVTSDPDGMEINNNLLGGNMTCLNNDPAVQYGDTGAAPNMVGGRGFGECGFNVLVPNPAASPGPPPVPAGPLEHIAVSTRSLKTYRGTHTSTNVTSLPAVKTESGYTLTTDINNFVLTGKGITGSGTYNGKPPGPGFVGEVVISTVYRNGSSSFMAIDSCASCSFAGHTGSVTIRAYGTTSANGSTYGTFLVVSGGAGNGGLSSLAGWGTFSSYGQQAGTLRLVEHLRIT